MKVLIKVGAIFFTLISICSNSAFSQIEKRCYEIYEFEIEQSKKLIPKNGDMTEFFYAQRKIRNKYFEMEPGQMIYQQKFIDAWEAYQRGIIDLDRAMQLTMQYMKEGYKPSFPAKTKPC